MNDCPNAAVRDLLPDLVHGRLRADVRAMVEEHVAGCPDCQVEVMLLRDLRGALRRTPALDVAAIVGAVPAYAGPARRSWVGWRTAAAITVLVAGGSSVVVLQRSIVPGPGTGALESPVAEASRPAPVQVGGAVATAGANPSSGPSRPMTQMGAPVGHAPAVAGQPAEGATDRDVGGRELAMAAGSLNDLSDRELTSLLRDIESLDAVPTIEVDNTPIAPIGPGHRQRAVPGAP